MEIIRAMQDDIRGSKGQRFANRFSSYINDELYISIGITFL